MKTYDRLRAALQEIANGTEYPMYVASEALRSRKVVGNPKPVRRKQGDARRAAKGRARKMYRLWVAAGEPPMSKFAASLGLNPKTGAHWISRGRRQEMYRRGLVRRLRKNYDLYAGYNT